VIFATVFAFEMPFAMRLTMAGLGQALHGFCFGCFLASAFMYIDAVVRKDLRASMQTLYGTCVLGIGFLLGGYVGGFVGDVFTSMPGADLFRESLGIQTDRGIVEFVTQSGEKLLRDWPGVWLSCAAIAAVALVIFTAAFPRTPAAKTEAEAR
jgi:MFS family permease